MPPRTKKKGSAKKTTPKPKVEEPKEDAQTSVINQDQQLVPVSTATEIVEEEQGKQVDDVEEVTTVTTTTVTVEESRVTEEFLDGSGVEEVNMVENFEESKVEEFEEEVKLGVGMEEGNVDEEAEAVEEDGNGDGEDEEYEPEEIEEDGEEEQKEQIEDGVEDVVENQETGAEATTGDVDNGSGDSEGEENESDSDDGDDEDDVNLSSYMQMAPVKDKKKLTEVEIFVGGLDRKAVEEDLTKVFGEYGEIKAVRIVKHPVTKKSKGYAFISYATSDQAKKVLTELKDGVMVKGKRAGVSPSQDSDTLYMGNICKTWTKEQLLESLKGYGVEQIEEIYLPEDPKNEGKIRGFGYLEFGTHSSAMAAFQRLRKPDAIFGRNKSAKVAFAPSMNPSEEALSQVKTVYVEGLTESWNEEKLKELCAKYGEVEKIQLSRDLATAKRKDFAFVSFTTRENAVACVEGINSTQIEEGDSKVKANLAKPQYKGKLGKKAARGGYKVTKEGEASKANGTPKSKGDNKGKGKSQVDEKKQAAKDNNRKRDGRNNTNSGPSGRPFKKPRGSSYGGGRPMNGSGNRGTNFRYSRGGRQAPPPRYHDMQPTMYPDPYVRGYGSTRPSYPGHGYEQPSDMGGYLRPAPLSQGLDLYDQRLRRPGGYAPQGSGVGSYPGSGAPPSYAHSYSSYPTGYEGHSSGVYGYPPPSSGSYVPRRTYY